MNLERAKQLFQQGYITANCWIAFKTGRKNSTFSNVDIYTARKLRDRYYREAKEVRIYHPDFDVPLFVQRM